MTKGKIAEIFDSIQGEGLYFGEKQLFVRLFGCNLDCLFCDTRLRRFMEYDAEELVKELQLYRDQYHSVSFTGGEPLMQKKFLKEALRLSRAQGYRTYLETNGTLPEALEEVIDDVDIIAMDIKLPSSSGHRDYWHVNYRFLEVASKKETFVKIVVCDSTTFEDFKISLQLIRDVDIGVVLVLQPNSYELSEALTQKLEHFRLVAEQEGVTVCVIPQIHRIMGMR